MIVTMTAVEHRQLADARRSTMVASSALRCAAETALDHEFRDRARRLLERLAAVTDELAVLLDRARVPR